MVSYTAFENKIERTHCTAPHEATLPEYGSQIGTPFRPLAGWTRTFLEAEVELSEKTARKYAARRTRLQATQLLFRVF